MKIKIYRKISDDLEYELLKEYQDAEIDSIEIILKKHPVTQNENYMEFGEEELESDRWTFK